MIQGPRIADLVALFLLDDIMTLVRNSALAIWRLYHSTTTITFRVVTVPFWCISRAM